jgi:hypothetical protein
MKNLEYYLIALGVLIATLGQQYINVGIAVTAGVLVAAFAGDIAEYIRKEQK